MMIPFPLQHIFLQNETEDYDLMHTDKDKGFERGEKIAVGMNTAIMME